MQQVRGGGTLLLQPPQPAAEGTRQGSRGHAVPAWGVPGPGCGPFTQGPRLPRADARGPLWTRTGARSRKGMSLLSALPSPGCGGRHRVFTFFFWSTGNRIDCALGTKMRGQSQQSQRH